VFTGIVEAVGRIERVVATRDPATGAAGAHLVVDAGTLDCADVAIGDSVALNGVCLTVVALASGATGARLEFDVSGETLAVTAGLADAGPVNLEKALRFGDRLDGHLVAGHVDGVGTVRRFESLGDDRLLEVEAPASLARFIAVKGSVCVDGVSLTVNTVAGTRFTANLIPHTLAATTLGTLTPGRRVNLEVDLIARYLDRLLAERGG
jgi:riboflavin synthase